MQMTIQCLIGAIMVAATVLVQASGTTWWLRRLMHRYAGSHGDLPTATAMRILIGTGTILVGLHVAQIILWAVVYRGLPTSADLPTMESAVYFSFVTFTTLGYGDITLDPSWRILSGIESMNGILLVGWSTATFFAAVQRIWHSSGGLAVTGRDT